MTLPENARTLRTGELPPVGSGVYVPANTTDIVGEPPATGWQTVRATDEGSSTVAVKSKDGYTSWVLSHNLLVDDKNRRPAVGDRVRINAPDEPHHGEVGLIVKDDKGTMPYFVEFQQYPSEWFYPHQVSLVSDGDTFPGEVDTTTTTAPTTVTTTTHVTLPRPATAEQVADALTHVDGHHQVTVHTYPDRIEIHANHEETRG